MSFSDIAFAAGFSSIRQFNDTVREVYAANPSQLRAKAAPAGEPSGLLELRLAVRQPFAAEDLLAFLTARAVAGVEETGPGWYSRTLRLPHGKGTVRLALDDDGDAVRCGLRLTDLRDLGTAVERCRRLLDADCDPVAVDDHLSLDPMLAPLVRRRPGLRVPGHVDGDEVAVRAVLGQQVSVARAQSLAALLAERYGEPGLGGEGRLFPSARSLAQVAAEELPMPRARGRALVVLCQALSAGDIALDRSAERTEVRRALLAVPGIGPWTAGYIAMRALGDPDVLLAGDVGLRQGLATLGVPAGHAETAGEAWRPWRSYAQMHVWSAAVDAASGRQPSGRRVETEKV